MRTLVTGGAGFIGSHLVRALLEQGATVRVLDDLSTGSLDNLRGLPVDFQHGDIQQVGDVEKALEGVDRVFHLAAFISAPESVTKPRACYAINVMGSLNVLEAAARTGVQRVVLASSAAVYGDAGGAVTEEMPKHPASPYAVSKLAMEETARLFSLTYNLETVCLRFFNVFGPGQSPDSAYAAVIPQFIHDLEDGKGLLIQGDGKQSRDFVFINDIVRACLLGMENPGAAGSVFNIGSGQSISINQLARALMALYPDAADIKFGPSREGDVRFSQADIRRAREVLSYVPKVAFEDGLHKTVTWLSKPRT